MMEVTSEAKAAVRNALMGLQVVPSHRIKGNFHVRHPLKKTGPLGKVAYYFFMNLTWPHKVEVYDFKLKRHVRAVSPEAYERWGQVEKALSTGVRRQDEGDEPVLARRSGVLRRRDN